MVAASALAEWVQRSGRCRDGDPAPGWLRFAFYGRVSTEDWQDPVTSRARQREQAGALVRGHGQIVAEFFDARQSRTVAWAAVRKRHGWPPCWRIPAGPGRDRGRAVRAGVLRQPVCGDGALVRALRRPVVDAGG